MLYIDLYTVLYIDLYTVLFYGSAISKLTQHICKHGCVSICMVNTLLKGVAQNKHVK